MPTTCYALQTVCEIPDSDVSGQKTALEDVFDTRTTVLPDQATAATDVYPQDTTNHIRQVKRLDTSESVPDAVDGLITALENNPNVSWYEVRRHDCKHDLTTGTGTEPCPDFSVADDSNGDPAQKGTVPGDV